jgi:AbrB family looped-hinge helix DNA binding protein
MEVHTKITQGGRIVIPRSFRKVLNLEEGSDIVVRLDKNELHVFSLAQAIKKTQAKVKQYQISKELVSEESVDLKEGEQNHE